MRMIYSRTVDSTARLTFVTRLKCITKSTELHKLKHG